MAKLIYAQDGENNIPTSNFPLAKFDFDCFNPVQSSVLDFYNKPINAIIAGSTGVGKTSIAEMFLSHGIRENKKSGLFLVPFKSLASEKVEDWTDSSHHFNDLKVSMSTGDSRISPEELNESDIVVMSMEMLNSKSRNSSDNFISKSGLLVVDEAHSIGVKGRGAHLEAGLIKYAHNNPNSRMVLLSATLPNVDEIGKWLCKITNRDTVILESKYRNCPLEIHYRSYDDSRGYKYAEESMIDGAIKLLQHYKTDKFLIFTPSKARGKIVEKDITECGIETGFHHANLPKDERKKLENRFKNDPSFRVLVATSGLSAGINTPARRVILLGVHRGTEALPVYDILQQVGRAGRPKYDDRGDAYIFIPQSKVSEQIARISNPPPIKSQLYNSEDDGSIKTLGFHLLSEVNNESIKNKNDIVNWYEDTFAKSQGMNLLDHDLDDVVLSLSRCGALSNKDELNITALGKASTIFYFSPWDASDLARNLSKVFLNNKTEDDYWVSYALANIDSNRTQVLSSSEKDAVSGYEKLLDKSGAKNGVNSFCPVGVLKYAYAYYCVLTGYYDIELEGLISGVKADVGRVCELIGCLNSSCKWNRKTEVDSIKARLTYGVPAHLVSLVQLNGIGRVKASKLYDHGIKTPKDIINIDLSKLTTALGCSRPFAEKLVIIAKEYNK